MSAKTKLFARDSIILMGRTFDPGDELPEIAVRHVNGFDIDHGGQPFITDRQGRHWRVRGAWSAGPATAELTRRYDPEVDIAGSLIDRGLATTDVGEAIALQITQLELLRQSAGEGHAHEIDTRISELRAQLPASA